MTLGGYANRVAHVDLTAGKVDYKPIPEEWATHYIGARGLGVRYVFENGPKVDPLSPDNLLCFMNGPLTGTAANMSGRLAIVTKSPLTGRGVAQKKIVLVASQWHNFKGRYMHAPAERQLQLVWRFRLRSLGFKKYI